MSRSMQVQTQDPGSAGVSRSEPGGRAQGNAGGRDAGRPPGVGDLPDRVRKLLPDGVVDELLAGVHGEEEIVGAGGLLSQLTKWLVERAMEVELTDYLGFEPHLEPPGGTGNARNGTTSKTLITEHGPVQIDTPRDRNGSFQPQIVRKRQRRFEGFDEKILALYSRGLSTRDIEAHLAEIYGVSVGRDLISRVTDAVMDDARAWQTRPLEDGRFLVVVANQVVMSCGFHRAINWVGVRSWRHARGLSLSSRATCRRCSLVTWSKLVPLGKYWRSKPLVFSLVGRCQGEWGSAK